MMSFADEKTGLDEVDCLSDATSPASTLLYIEGGKQRLHKHTGFPQLICGEGDSLGVPGFKQGCSPLQYQGQSPLNLPECLLPRD